MGFIYHLLQPPVQRPAGQRYAVVVASLALAFAARVWLDPWLLWHSPFALLLPAVLVSAWYGGFRAGLLATALGGIGAVYAFVIPDGLVIRSVSDAAAFLLFVVEGLLCSAVCEVLHHAVGRAQRAATDAARKFEGLANSAPVLIWSTDPAGQCTFVNRPWLTFTGRTSAQELGAGWTALVHPDDQAARRQAHADAVTRRRAFELEYRLRRADGTYRWLLERATPWLKEDGTFAGFIGSCTDITTARREREELDFVSRLQRHLGSSLDPERLGAVLAETIVPDLADWFRLELVREPDRLETLRAQPAQPANFAPPTLSSTVLETGEAQFCSGGLGGRLAGGDERLRPRRARPGRPVHLAVPLLARGRIVGVLTVAMAESGRSLGGEELALLRKIAGLAGFALDNARLHHDALRALAAAEQSRRQMAASEHALEQQRGLLQSIIDAVPALVAYLGTDGHVVLHNRRATDWLGAVDRPGEFLARAAGGDSASYWRTALTGEPVAYEDVLPAGAGERRVAAVLLPDRDAQGRVRGVVFHAYDITDRQNAYAELATARELLRCHADELEERVRQRTATLRETNAELEAFTCSVSHDLRTPLQYLRSYAEALDSDPANTFSPESQEHLARIGRAAARMDSIIDDLLGYSRLARADMVLAPVSLEQAVADAISHHQSAIARAGATVHVASPLPRVLADPVGLFQILTNLLSNALKFVEPGRAPAIRIRAETGPVFTRLWIADNGIGIPARHHEKIFQLFERLEGAADYPGTGVGLALVRKAAIRMGGQCGVESAAGAGSRFWIDFVPDKGGSRVPAATVGESRMRG